MDELRRLFAEAREVGGDDRAALLLMATKLRGDALDCVPRHPLHGFWMRWLADAHRTLNAGQTPTARARWLVSQLSGQA